MHAFSRGLCCGGATLCALAAFFVPRMTAQEDGPPKVLVIQREYLKPGKGGMLHDRSESAFVKAFATGEPNVNYFAMDSLSGASRSLFLAGFDSFAEWGKMNAAVNGNKMKAAAVDHASLMDGDLLSSYDQVAMALRPDLSLNKGGIKGTRFFEITTFIVKPGHRQDFEELAKMYAEAYRKAAPDNHWDCFEVVYGTVLPGVPAGATFVVMNTMKSLAETDKGIGDSDKVGAAMGKAGAAKAAALEAASVETETTNLFEINPRMSNVPKEWLSWDPGFWTGPVASAKKAAAKTAAP